MNTFCLCDFRHVCKPIHRRGSGNNCRSSHNCCTLLYASSQRSLVGLCAHSLLEKSNLPFFLSILWSSKVRTNKNIKEFAMFSPRLGGSGKLYVNGTCIMYCTVLWSIPVGENSASYRFRNPRSETLAVNKFSYLHEGSYPNISSASCR